MAIYYTYDISKDDISSEDTSKGKSKRRITMAINETPLTEAFYYILLALRKPNHGYGITQEVDEMTNGRVQLGAGTLYGALQSLEKKGWIEIFSADATSRKKKEYVITSLGVQAFAKELERLNELVRNGKMMEEANND